MTPLAQTDVARATETRIASYLLAEYLERLGVEAIFGLCGHTVIAFLDALGKSRIRFITARHQQAAAPVSAGRAPPLRASRAPRARGGSRSTPARQEQVAAHAADGYARASGKPGV